MSDRKFLSAVMVFLVANTTCRAVSYDETGFFTTEKPAFTVTENLWAFENRAIALAFKYDRDEGAFMLVRGGDPVREPTPLQRGDLLIAGEHGTTLHLGGYCQLELEPNTEVVLGGARGQEAVALDAGKLT